MATLTGKTVGGYRIMEEVGRGGMGVVFKAQQLSMDRTVAIKFLPQKLAEDPKIVARFLREARAAGKLSHPNIVSVHDAGIADGLHYIAMELVEGTSCYKRIKMLGAYTEKEALQIGGQMAEALRYAHSKNILHRDIKPDNFLTDTTGRVRLADLGLARFVGKDGTDSELTQDGTTMGTPYYMSPEQCKGMGVDARSDIYSLGASLYMLSCGTPPYREAKAGGPGAVLARVLTEPPTPMLTHNPKLSPDFIALVQRLMHRDPEKRFAEAGEVVKAIELCKIGNFSAGSGASASARKTGPARKVSTIKQVFVGAFCAILFIIFLSNIGKKHANNTPADLNAQQPAPLPVNTATATAAASEKVDPAVPPLDPEALKKENEAARRFDAATLAMKEKNISQARDLANDLIVKFAETKFVQSHIKEITNLTLP